jgi:hypothetical protein
MSNLSLLTQPNAQSFKVFCVLDRDNGDHFCYPQAKLDITVTFWLGLPVSKLDIMVTKIFRIVISDPGLTYQ